MTRFFVIFNPAARGEKSRRVQQFLDSKRNDHITLAPTQEADDARRLAAQAVADGYDLIVAAGGDGTVNEVINGIGLSGVALGILPLGTVNVFAQDLGIPGKMDEAWTVVESGTIRTIDLARAESKGRTRFFVQLAGVGFDARAVRVASWALKKKIGPLSYVWAGLKALRERHADVTVELVEGAAPAATVEVSGMEGHAPSWPRRRTDATERVLPGMKGVVVLIGNGRFYGGPFRLFPEARMDDGLLDVCVFEKGGYFDMLRYGQGILRGVHTGFPDVRYFQAKEFVCSAAQPVPFELDGEDAGEVPVRFSVMTRALRVMTPDLEGTDGRA
jgi:diacylglycerol kinase (ATP)